MTQIESRAYRDIPIAFILVMYTSDYDVAKKFCSKVHNMESFGQNVKLLHNSIIQQLH